MLIRLQSSLGPAELRAVESVAQSLGYAFEFLGGRRDLVQLTFLGDAATVGPDHVAQFADLSGVAAILDRGESKELWRSAPDRDATVIRARHAVFSKTHVSIIAGPCAVEDEERLLDVAQAVEARGATLLRGGAFKPRTSPYSFQGLGHDGLRMLAAVRAQTSLGIVTEVMDPRDVGAVADVADMVQVGARSMANYALLKELGQIEKPVLLKRGFGATVAEFLGAAEYILAGGNGQVVLCERGIRGFDNVTRNVLDVGAIAHLAAATHLPIVADPSHAAGRSDLVRAVGRAGLTAGAHGLMLEVHPAPSEVHSDGQQAIGLDEFEALVGDARALSAMDGRTVVTCEAPVGASLPTPVTNLRGTA